MAVAYYYGDQKELDSVLGLSVLISIVTRLLNKYEFNMVLTVL